MRRVEILRAARLAALLMLLGSAWLARAEGAAQPVAKAAEAPVARVLILYGVDPWLPASLEVDRALRAALRREAGGRLADVYGEVVEDGRFRGVDVEAAAVGLLREKYRATRVDLVVPLSGFALNFAQKYRAQLWPDAPIVFHLFAPERLESHKLGPRTTGVLGWQDPSATLALARRLQPDARRLVIVGGTTGNDQVRVSRVVEAAQSAHPDLPITRIDDRTLGDTLEAVAALSSDSIVFYTAMFRDASGQSFVPAEVAERLAAAASVPVYSNFSTLLGRGIVGGQMNDYAAEGQLLGSHAAAVLTGRIPPDAPVLEPRISRCVFDVRQIERFGLSSNRLPDDCQLAFQSHSLWLEHRTEFIAGLVLIALQAVLIVTLLQQRRRTRLAAAEAQTARTELAHAARLATVGELTAAISHEINQPLGAVQSNADAAEMLLGSDSPRIDRVRQILSDIRAANLRASEVVQRLRALLVKDERRAEPADLATVVEAVLRLVQGEAARRRVRIDTDIAAQPLSVIGDPVQLQQVLLNLLINAMDAVAGNDTDRRRVNVRLVVVDERHAQLQVADLGFGIPPLAVPQLFRSFYSTKKGGMGLGLSITRTIVHAHGGRIEAVNNADGGATFTVTLPVTRAQAAAKNQQQDQLDAFGQTGQA